MRISDWSSDVCSSDLAAFLAVGIPGLLLALWVLSLREPRRGAIDGLGSDPARPGAWRDFGRKLLAILPPLTFVSVARIPGALGRSEERRVGKECVITCRSRWSP